MGYIAVCGGVNIDIGARSFAPLIARDSNPGTVRSALGGVGRNIAHNLSLLGERVTFLTALGADEGAARIERSCHALGIDLSHALRVPNGTTSTYLFISAPDGDMALAVSDMAICERLTVGYWAEKLAVLNGAEAVVLDANLPQEALIYLAQHCTVPLFADCVSVTKAQKLAPILPQLHTLKPNALEAEVYTGIAVRDAQSAEAAAQKLIETGVKRVFLSMGRRGVLAAQAGEMCRQACIPAQTVNATGAGDAMMAALASAYVRGMTLRDSAAFAAAAASIAVEGAETINPKLSRESVRGRLENNKESK